MNPFILWGIFNAALVFERIGKIILKPTSVPIKVNPMIDKMSCQRHFPGMTNFVEQLDIALGNIKND